MGVDVHVCWLFVALFVSTSRLAFLMGRFFFEPFFFFFFFFFFCNSATPPSHRLAASHRLLV